MMKRSAWSRLWALVLTCMMLVSMVPAEALGEGGVSGTGYFNFKAARAAGSYNLNDFVTEEKLHLSDLEDGKYVMYPGMDYTLSLTFTEDGETKQFGSDSYEFVYTLPDGICPSPLMEGGTASYGPVAITEQVDGSPDDWVTRNYTVHFTYHIDTTTNSIKVVFADDEATQKYLTLVNNGKLSIEAKIRYDESKDKDKIEFGDGHSYDVVKVPSSLEVQKTHGNVYAQGNEYQIEYYIDVTSKGRNEDVTIKDTIKQPNTIGAKYKYDTMYVQKKNSWGGWDTVSQTISVNQGEDCFTYSLGTLKNGESYRLVYKVAIPRDENTINKPAEIGNGVQVSSKDNPNVAEDTNDYKIEWLPKYDVMGKYGELGEKVETDGKNYQIVKWTINVNSEAAVNLNGKQLKDTLGEGMFYYGDGIYEGDTLLKSWADLDVDTTKDTSFTYTFSDDAPKAHTITYETIVCVDDFAGNKYVTNTADYDNGGENGGETDSSGVNVQGEMVKIDKEFVGMNYADDTMTWTITLTVPETATKVVVKDIYPNSSQWLDGTQITYEDRVISCEWKGLKENETATTNEDGSGAYQITLSLNGSSDENASESKRNIVFTVVTKLDPEWKDLDQQNPWTTSFERTNGVNAVVDDKWEVSDTAKGNYTVVTLNKYGQDNKKVTIDKDGFPVFNYKIEIKNVQVDEAEFTDVFDTSMFKLSGNVTVQHGSEWNANKEPVSVVETNDGMTLTVHFKKNDKDAYYDLYTIYYSLTVKDQTAYEKLIELAKKNNGKFTPANTIYGLGKSSGGIAEWLPTFEYKPVNKYMSEEPSATNRYVATYTIVINESGIKLNNGQPIEVTDVMTNLRLVEGSVVVKENWHDATPNYITDGNTVVFTVRDGVRTDITYKARMIFSNAEETENGNYQVPISNTASIVVFGDAESDTEQKIIEADSSATFSGSQNMVTIKKVSALNSTVAIPGVKFDLYQYDELTGNTTKIYTGLVTKQDGTVTVATTVDVPIWAYDEATTQKIRYYLVETEAPAGYEVDSTPIWFTLYSHPTNIRDDATDYPSNGGTVTVVNYPTDAKLPKIVKVDAGTGEPLSGAEFVLTNEAGETVATWVSGEAAHYFRKGLADGDYTLKETSVPDGYTTEGDMCVHFTVKDNVFSSATSNSNAIGVQTSDDGLTLTVTNKEIAKTEITVSKKWENLGNQDVAYPDSITIRLCRQIAGQSEWTEVSVVTLSDENNGWTYTWSDLPETDSNGNQYSYQVFENEVPGYRPWVIDGETGKEITNTLITIGVKVTKKWVGDTEDERPDEITVQLFRDDDAEKPYREATLRKGENIVTWEYLPKVNPTTKQDYVYTVKEQIPDAYKNDYSSEVTEEATSSDDVIAFLITNTKIEKTEFAVEKVWIGDEESQRPANIKVQLKQNGEKYGEPVTIAADAEGKWNYKWSDLPAKDANGKAYTYTVEEKNVPKNYESKVAGTTITNTLKTTSYEVEKKWVGDEESNRPASITVKLLQNNKEYKTAELTASGNWSYSWTNLPAEDAQGNAYTYTVDEVEVPTNYAKSVKTDGTKTTITNTRNTKTTSLSVEKVWVGGVGAESVKVQLYRNGVALGDPVELSEENEWKHDWTNLVAGEVKDGAWVTYTYKLDEVNVPKNYTKTVETDGTKTTITNTRNTETTSLSVEKVWVGGVGAESVKVQLYRNDVALGDPVELNAENEWKHDWTNLVAGEVKDGVWVTYTYTVDEVEVPKNYTKTVETDGTKTTITNTRNTETTSLSVEKVWVGGVGAESVKVQLYRDDVALGDPVELSEENEWKHDWTNLVAGEVKDGAWVTYTYKLDEVNVPTNYTKSVKTDGTKTTITNTLETTSYEVEKVWEDNNNEAKLRPESIEVQLLQNDEAYGEAVTVKADENGKWTHTWTNLPAKDAEGDEYTYKVEEVKVNGYDVTYDTTSTPDKKITKTTITNKKIVTPAPSTAAPTTVAPTTVAPTTVAPTTVAPTTVAPTTVAPTTVAPTTVAPTTVAPTTVAPTTVAPTTVAPTTVAPTTVAPTTVAPTTVAPTTVAPTTVAPTTVAPTTAAPTTVAPTTVAPTTPIPTDEPTPIPTDEPTPAPTEIPVPTPTPIPEFTAVRVVKVWQDFEDYDQIRPESVTVHLQRRVNGGDYETVDTIELTGEGDIWSYTFRRLPTMNERGLLYQYRVREEEVEGYAVQYNGYTITNVHAAVTPTPEPTPEPTPTPTPTPLPTPVVVNPTPERATGMQYIDGEWYWIDDMGVPLGVVAQTGDDDNLAAALVGMAVLIVLAGALAFMIIKKEKRKHS